MNVSKNRSVMSNHSSDIVADRWTKVGIAEDDTCRKTSTPFDELWKKNQALVLTAQAQEKELHAASSSKNVKILIDLDYLKDLSKIGKPKKMSFDFLWQKTANLERAIDTMREEETRINEFHTQFRDVFSRDSFQESQSLDSDSNVPFTWDVSFEVYTTQDQYDAVL